MSIPKIQPLAEGYSYEADTRDEESWNQLLRGFTDGNIFQTWAYAESEEGRGNLSPLVLTRNGEVVAAALVRFRRLPVLGMGLAYVHRGPMWRRKGADVNIEDFRQVLRALRNEFVCKRGLTLRLNPPIFDDDALGLGAIISEEGFLAARRNTPNRTILMDLTPSLANLRDGMSSHWKRELKIAEKNNLEIIEGTGVELIDSFIELHREMVARKKYVPRADLQQFRQVQARLPEFLRMRVLLCRSADGMCAGAIYSQIGNGAFYLFGATSNSGKKSRGSYLLQWRIVQSLKQQGTTIYNLHGIDPASNPGTYKFKSDLAGTHGRDVFFIGRFDASAGHLSRLLLQFRDAIKTRKEKVQQ